MVGFVFDASALLAYLKDEPGSVKTAALLAETGVPRLVHAVNLCECYYHLMRHNNEQVANEAVVDLIGTGLVAREDLDALFWHDTARLKAEISHASLADCFAVALARRIGGTVVTADHPAFEAAAAREHCSVHFIR